MVYLMALSSIDHRGCNVRWNSEFRRLCEHDNDQILVISSYLHGETGWNHREALIRIDCPGWGLNQALSKYKSGLLLSEPETVARLDCYLWSSGWILMFIEIIVCMKIVSQIVSLKNIRCERNGHYRCSTRTVYLMRISVLVKDSFLWK